MVHIAHVRREKDFQGPGDKSSRSFEADPRSKCLDAHRAASSQLRTSQLAVVASMLNGWMDAREADGCIDGDGDDI